MKVWGGGWVGNTAGWLAFDPYTHLTQGLFYLHVAARGGDRRLSLAISKGDILFTLKLLFKAASDIHDYQL